jgi:hypothetical protein
MLNLLIQILFMWDKDVILSLFRLNGRLDLAQIVGSKLDISVSNSNEIKLNDC